MEIPVQLRNFLHMAVALSLVCGDFMQIHRFWFFFFFFFFFEQTNSDHYVMLILKPLFRELTVEEIV